MNSEPDKSTTCLRFNVFAWLWAAAALFSLLARWEWAWTLVYGFPAPLGLAGLFVAVSAILVLVQPGSLSRISALALSLPVLAFVEMPAVPNHRLVLGLVSLAFLFAAAGTKVTAAKGTDIRELVWRRFASSARWIAILVYFFAFLAKLNTGFLDPAHSCAIEFYGNIRRTLGGLLPDNQAVKMAVIWGTLVFEGLLPLLLLIPKTRIIAVLLGLAFHSVLALDLVKLFFNFSAVMSPLLLLFLPDRFFESSAARWRKWSERKGISTESVSMLSVVVMLLLIATSIMSAELPSLTSFYLPLVAIFWSLHALVLLASVILFVGKDLREPKESWEPPMLKPLAPAQAIVLALVLLNGLSPYLGLKTRTGFNMYSNLRIEPGVSNHFFLPPSPDLLGHLGETVRIVSISDRQWHAQHVEAGWRATYFSLAQRVTSGVPIEVYYQREGLNGPRKVFHFLTGRTDSEPIERPPWILRKLLIYRPLGDGVEKKCFW